MKDDRVYLIHIWECIQRIESYANEGRSASGTQDDAGCDYQEL